jgi:endonuclease VIII
VPEGDSIHYSANRIRPVLAGRVPESIDCPQPRHRLDRWPERLAGRTVTAVDAHGKHLFLRFEGGLVVHSHLRTTGAWSVVAAGGRWRRAQSRAWMVLRSAGRDVVQFDGPVRELMTESRTRLDQQLAALGPDILAPELDFATIRRRLRADDPTRGIGDALLDQRIVAGIGNMWKAEACWTARIDPWRPAEAIDDDELASLLNAAREPMRQAALEGPGAHSHSAYRRVGRPCPRCGARIRSRGQGDDNRMTYWCPGCQH